MVGGVVDEVAKHLPERVDVFPTAGRLYEPRLVEPSLGHPGEKRAPLRLDRFPAAPHLSQRLQVGALRDGGVRLPDPAVQPQLLGPDDVRQRAVNAAVAAFQVAEILLLRELSDRVEDRSVRPGVVVEQLYELGAGA